MHADDFDEHQLRKLVEDALAAGALIVRFVVAKRMKLSSRPFDATDLPRPRRMKRGSESSSGKYLPPAAGVESPLAGQKGLAGDLIALIDELNTYGDGTMLVADGDDVDHK